MNSSEPTIAVASMPLRSVLLSWDWLLEKAGVAQGKTVRWGRYRKWERKKGIQRKYRVLRNKHIPLSHTPTCFLRDEATSRSHDAVPPLTLQDINPPLPPPPSLQTQQTKIPPRPSSNHACQVSVGQLLLFFFPGKSYRFLGNWFKAWSHHHSGRRDKKDTLTAQITDMNLSRSLWFSSVAHSSSSLEPVCVCVWPCQIIKYSFNTDHCKRHRSEEHTSELQSR